MGLPPIHVIVADDHPIVQQGMCSLLTGHPRIHVDATAQSFLEVRSLLAALHDRHEHLVLIVDIAGMGDSPLGFIAYVQRHYPQHRIIMFSSHLNFAPDLVAAGVHGYLTKEEMCNHLITAIEVVADGGTYYSHNVTDHLESCSSVRTTFQLAPREVCILEHLSSGLSTLEIAEVLQIDARTVQNYITGLRRKLHCHERTQLVKWYEQMHQGIHS